METYIPIIGVIIILKIVFWVTYCACRFGACREQKPERRCTVIRVVDQPGLAQAQAQAQAQTQAQAQLYPQDRYTDNSGILKHEVPPGMSPVPMGFAPPPTYDQSQGYPGVSTMGNPTPTIVIQPTPPGGAVNNQKAQVM